LVAAFSLEGLQVANGIFDPEKLKWMNGKYISAMPIDDLYGILKIYLKQFHPDFYENTLIAHEEGYNRAVLLELQKRLETLEDFIPQTDFFYSEPMVDVNLLLSEKMNITSLVQAKEALQIGLDILKNDYAPLINRRSAVVEGESKGDCENEKTPPTPPYQGGMALRETLKNIFLPKIAELGKKNGQILWPLRVALTGKEFSPGAFEMVEILGFEKAMQRIEKALKTL